MPSPATQSPAVSARGSRRQIVALAGMCVALLTMPLLWRAARLAWGPPASSAPPSYLPALELARVRAPFDSGPIENLTSMDPGIVVIGDSMAGRIDPGLLTELSGTPVAPILQNATGSAYWYLVFKNYVVASGISPRVVLVFFRDTNLTDPMFRVAGEYRNRLDEVAHDREDELNAVVAARSGGAWFRSHVPADDRWARVHTLVDGAYGIERARIWLEPAMTGWVTRVVVGTQRRRAFQAEMNAMFELEHLRVMTAADMAATSERDTDFGANVDASTLPLFLDLAHRKHIRLCFVRVLRRPDNGRPPDDSPGLTRYVQDMRRYIEGHGATLIDDRDDPDMAKLAYADGDHIAREEKRHYTSLFYLKLSRVAR